MFKPDRAVDEVLKRLETLCQGRGWPVKRPDPQRNTVECPFGALDVTAVSDGIRFSMDLGRLKSSPCTGPSTARRMLELNGRPWLGKLGLAPGGTVCLTCEFLMLDENGFGEVTRLFERETDSLRKELTES
jgi:hypothetical protein